MLRDKWEKTKWMNSNLHFSSRSFNFIKMTIMCMRLGYMSTNAQQRGDFHFSICDSSPNMAGMGKPRPQGSQFCRFFCPTWETNLCQQTHGPLGSNTSSIRKAVGSCLVSSSRQKHRRARKCDPLLNLCMMLAVGPVGALNLYIHMTHKLRTRWFCSTLFTEPI